MYVFTKICDFPELLGRLKIGSVLVPSSYWQRNNIDGWQCSCSISLFAIANERFNHVNDHVDDVHLSLFDLELRFSCEVFNVFIGKIIHTSSQSSKKIILIVVSKFCNIMFN